MIFRYPIMFIYESLFTMGTAEWFITDVSLFMLPHFCCFVEPLFMIGAAVLNSFYLNFCTTTFYLQK